MIITRLMIAKFTCWNCQQYIRVFLRFDTAGETLKRFDPNCPKCRGKLIVTPTIGESNNWPENTEYVIDQGQVENRIFDDFREMQIAVRGHE